MATYSTTDEDIENQMERLPVLIPLREFRVPKVGEWATSIYHPHSVVKVTKAPSTQLPRIIFREATHEERTALGGGACACGTVSVMSEPTTPDAPPTEPAVEEPAPESPPIEPEGPIDPEAEPAAPEVDPAAEPAPEDPAPA